MHTLSTPNFFYYRLFLLLIAIVVVHANTEIRHFKPDRYTDPNINTSLILQALEPHLSDQTTLSAPYSFAGIETIASVQSTDSTMAQREKWYCLQNLSAGHSYEVRVSYAATTPADFHIELHTLETLASIYNVSFAGNESVGKHVYGAQDDRLVTMYARVSAVYSGMSTAAGNMENRRIPYRFVLEKHVLGLPYQALKLIAAIVAVLVVSFAVVVPRVLTALNAVFAETTQKSKQE